MAQSVGGEVMGWPASGVGVEPSESDAARAAEREAGWRMIFGVLVAVAFAHAFLLPLSDIDLPMHLAVGEWIARHHALPRVEPFAWTRAGAPYFAYSWLVELGAYLLLAAAGPAGAHLLHGLIIAASVAAILVLGRAYGWRSWTTFVVAVLHLVVLTRVTPSLRPQGVMYAYMPLAWAAAAWLERDARPVRGLVVLFLVSALAANSYILFPLLAAPVLVLAARPPANDRRRVLWAALAVLLGWLCTPYALDWPAVFHLNFARNLLFPYPSGIDEYQPGFIIAPAFGILLAALPWVAATGRRLDRRAIALGVLWLVGLVGFAQAEKALSVWWLLSLPLVGRAAARVPEPRSPRRVRALAAVPIAIALLLCIESIALGSRMRSSEGTVETRTLPGQWSESAEPLASWLAGHAHPAGRPRLLTTFNYGSYLEWRLPAYSPSIDSRTIFPDSAAAPEAMVVRAFAGGGLGPWRSADVAMVPRRYPVAAVLDTAAGWTRLATNVRGPLGLWARRAWWDSVRVPVADRRAAR